jgi:hypothetical protein
MARAITHLQTVTSFVADAAAHIVSATQDGRVTITEAWGMAPLVSRLSDVLKAVKEVPEELWDITPEEIEQLKPSIGEALGEIAPNATHLALALAIADALPSLVGILRAAKAIATELPHPT